MFNDGWIWMSGVDGGGVDLDELEEQDSAGEDEDEDLGEDSGKGKGKDSRKDLSRDEVNQWLVENGWTAYDVNDPILKKLYDKEHGAAPAAAAADDADKDLEDLLTKNPAKYAAEIARRASERTRAETGEATRLTNQILRELQKEVPDLDQEDYDRISEDVSSASLEQLRDWKKRGSVITAGKAASFDRAKKGGAKRAPNSNTERTRQGGGESKVPTGLQPKLAMMADAMRANGIDVKNEDIAESGYMPRRK